MGDHDGRGFVLAGNCGGGLICVDSTTGEGIWSSTVYDTDGLKVGQVSSISLCSDGRALVCYSSGEMSSTGGGVMLIDVTDGSVIWQYDIRCGKTTVQGDRFYAYVSASGSETVKDYRTGQDIELVNGYYSFWVDDFSCLWYRATEALSIGGLTYCDGRLYSMDYSPGTEGSVGGWVWCMDSDTGGVVWKVKVTPYSGSSYSMCTPTVVDGKVECISVTAASRAQGTEGRPGYIPARGRRNGDTFREQFSRARDLGAGTVILISWNEWTNSEQLSLEISKDLEPSATLGTFYYDLMKEEIARFKEE